MIGMPVPPRPPLHSPPGAAPEPRGRTQVLGCLAVLVVLGLVFIVWLSGWWEQRRAGERAERARIHHLRRVGEDRLRGRITVEEAAGQRTGTVTPERVRAGELLAERMAELFADRDWAGVIQCAGLLEDLPADDPALGLMLEKALFNRALQLLRQNQAAPALECLETLVGRQPMDRQATDLRAIGRTIRDYGSDQQTATELERFSERQ